MNSSLLLADLGNVGLVVSAVLTTASVAAYAWLARGQRGPHGRWWRSGVGVHIMTFMAAFAWVLDQSVIYMLTTTGVLLRAAPPFRPDWFAWERVISFDLLIPAVLAWRLAIIIRPPRPPGDGSSGNGTPDAGDEETLCSPGLPPCCSGSPG